MPHQVLVHAGTGGVGLAAINVAQALGCRVFATAGTAQKRSLLRSLGAQTAASSRDTDFVDIMAYREGASSSPFRADTSSLQYVLKRRCSGALLKHITALPCGVYGCTLDERQIRASTYCRTARVNVLHEKESTAKHMCSEREGDGG